MTGAPERIELGTLVLRRWRVGDAPDLTRAVLDSLEHLRPWMPWAANEPVDRVPILERWVQAWADGTELNYGLFVDGRVAGSCGLMRRIGPNGWEIGYWVHVDHVGRGHATAAARALSDVAFAMPRTTHVEIHHDTANVVSGRVPARLGFRLIGDEPDQVLAPGEVGVKRIWRLTRADWEALL